MKTVIRLALIAALLAGGPGLATAATDDPQARARAAFKAGSQHYNLGEFEQALESFRAAYRNVEDPSFLFNIAQCERQLGHKREAVREYRAYLNNAGEAADRDAIQKIIVQLDKEIEDERRSTKMPPTNVTPPSSEPAVTTQPAGVTLTATVPARHADTPAYKKWWVWTIVGGVVVAGAGAGLAVALTRHSSPSYTYSPVNPF